MNVRRHRTCATCKVKNLVTDRDVPFVCAACREPARCLGCTRECSDADLRYADGSTVSGRCAECRAANRATPVPLAKASIFSGSASY